MIKKTQILFLLFCSLNVVGENIATDSIITNCENLNNDSLVFDCLYHGNVISFFGKGQYNTAIDLLEKIKNEKYVTTVPANSLSVHSGLGTLYYVLADNETSITQFTYAIKLCDSIKELNYRKPDIVSKLAVVFSEMGQSENAKKLYKESIDELLKTQDSLELDYSHYYNLGAEYLNQDSINLAIPLFNKSKQIAEIEKDTVAIINCATALSTVLNKQERYVKSRISIDRAIDLSLLIGDTLGYANALIVVADILEYDGKIGESLKFTEEAINIFKKYGRTSRVIDVLKSNAKSLYKLKEYKISAEYYAEYVELKDSTNQVDVNTQIAEFDSKYEAAKKENQIKLLQENEKVQKAQEEKSNLIIVGGAFGLLLLVAFLIFVYNRLRITKKQNKVIESQKLLVDNQRSVLEEKNLQIIDSIGYARRIQKAVIPTEEQIKKNFSDAFVFYKPKDIVSGDFYWQQKVGDLILISVADCTGHGVPGAFMSMIGTSLLDKAVLELGITSPEKILNQLNKDLYERLHVNEEADVKDGMDLFICAIDLKTNMLYSSGAYNPMYIIRGEELTEFKGDRLHLGNLEHTEGKSYSLNTFELKKDDCIYMFTDGYVDQKGGEKNKKFYYAPFRQMLIDNSNKKMQEQKEVLYETYNHWKRNESQMDDVCIIGLKI